MSATARPGSASESAAAPARRGVTPVELLIVFLILAIPVVFAVIMFGAQHQRSLDQKHLNRALSLTVTAERSSMARYGHPVTSTLDIEKLAPGVSKQLSDAGGATISVSVATIVRKVQLRITQPDDNLTVQRTIPLRLRQLASAR